MKAVALSLLLLAACGRDDLQSMLPPGTATATVTSTLPACTNVAYAVKCADGAGGFTAEASACIDWSDVEVTGCQITVHETTSGAAIASACVQCPNGHLPF